MIQGETGDLMFTAGSGDLASAIQWAERVRGEEPTEMNHVGVVSRPGYILPSGRSEEKPAVVIESLWRTIEHPWFPTLLQGIIVAQRARKFVGAKYGWWKLFTHLFDNKVLNGKLVARRLLRADSRPICSYTAATAFACAGIRTGTIPARAQSPDSMWDYVNNNDLWFEVGRGTVKEVA
jgi:hypothetical protein